MQVVEVALEDGSTTLCMIPSKFNKRVWIKVGGILIIDRPVPLDGDAKITSDVISVLSQKDLKNLNRAGIVPMDVTACHPAAPLYSDIGSDAVDLQPNPNHRQAVHYDLSDSDSGLTKLQGLFLWTSR